MPELDMRLVYSVRSAADVIYAYELGEETVLTFTREPPADWRGLTGRIDASLITKLARDARLAFVCGTNGFVESAVELLLQAAVRPSRIRTERFGPTG
jgi:ferredoxin-NADP reductase